MAELDEMGGSELAGGGIDTLPRRRMRTSQDHFEPPADGGLRIRYHESIRVRPVAPAAWARLLVCVDVRQPERNAACQTASFFATGTDALAGLVDGSRRYVRAPASGSPGRTCFR